MRWVKLVSCVVLLLPFIYPQCWRIPVAWKSLSQPVEYPHRVLLWACHLLRVAVMAFLQMQFFPKLHSSRKIPKVPPKLRKFMTERQFSPKLHSKIVQFPPSCTAKSPKFCTKFSRRNLSILLKLGTMPLLKLVSTAFWFNFINTKLVQALSWYQRKV